MASLFGASYKTQAEILAEEQARQSSAQQGIIARNMANAQSGYERDMAGIGSMLGTVGGMWAKDKFGKPSKASAAAAQQQATIAKISAQGGSQPAQRTNATTPQGGITTQTTAPAKTVPQSQRLNAQAKLYDIEAAKGGDNAGFYATAGNNARKEALTFKTAEDKQTKLALAATALAKKERGQNINANSLINLGHNDLAVAVETGGMPADKAFELAYKRDKPEPNKHVTNEDGSITIIDNDGNVVNTVKDPAEAAKMKKKHNKLLTTLATTDRVIGNISKIRVLADDEGAAGAEYKLLSGIPGTDSYALANKLVTMKAELTFGQLNQMRENSEDGSSGLGQVAVVEINLLGAKVAELDPSVGKEAFNDALNDVQQHYDNIRNISLGKAPKINWDDPAYAENTKMLGEQRYFKDAGGTWHEVK